MLSWNNTSPPRDSTGETREILCLMPLKAKKLMEPLGFKCATLPKEEGDVFSSSVLMTRSH